MSKNESVQILVRQISNNRLEAIPPFGTISNSTKIKIRCMDCMLEFQRSVSTIYKKKKTQEELLCPRCHPKKTKAFSRQEYNNRILQLSNNTIELDISCKYKNVHDELVFKCKRCGNSFNRKGTTIYSDAVQKNGVRCPFCDTSGRVHKMVHMTHEQYIERFYQIQGNEKFNVISQYTNSKCKMQLQCKKCGSILTRHASGAIKSKIRCETCYHNKRNEMSQIECHNNDQKQKDRKDDAKNKYLEWLKQTNSNIELYSEYVDRKTVVTLRCRRCGCLFQRKPYSQSHGKPSCCCPKCDGGRDVLPGVNDIETVAPWMLKYFKYPNDYKNCKPTSNKKVSMICPHCKMEKEVRIVQLYHQGFSCSVCSDGVSYPNKYISNLLNHKNIPYIREALLDDRLFDCEIKWHGESILVEMDGGLGHGDFEIFNRSIDDQLANDKYKDEIAAKYDYKLIRIDCNYPSLKCRSDYIRENITKSDLQTIFHFTPDDFEYAAKQSFTSNVILVSQLWNKGVYDFSEYISATSCHHNTVRRYLREAVDAGLISNATYETVYTVLTIKTGQSRPIICNETGQTYRTICDAEKEYKGVRGCINGRGKHAGRLADGTRLTWRALSAEEYIERMLYKADGNA